MTKTKAKKPSKFTPFGREAPVRGLTAADVRILRGKSSNRLPAIPIIIEDFVKKPSKIDLEIVDSDAFRLLHEIFHDRDFRARVSEDLIDKVDHFLAKAVGRLPTSKCQVCESQVLGAEEKVKQKLIKILREKPMRTSQALRAARIKNRRAGENAIYALMQENRLRIGPDSVLYLIC